MKKKRDKTRKNKAFPLLLSIIVVFCMLGTIVFAVAQKISSEMSASAIQNLSESLDLMKGTMEAILVKEAEFQKLMAKELVMLENPENFIQSYDRNQTMVRITLILSGETEGISNTGEVLSEEELDFSSGKTVDGLPISQSYMNYMGTWAYSMKCPVMKDNQELGTLYVEYIYDTFEESLPNGFYNGRAMLYIMDAKTERLVLKPKGMGERNAGHLNLQDFYRANNIWEQDLRAEVFECVKNGTNILFYHDIRGKNSLNYMWSLNQGSLYMIGYVPIEAIQQEGRAVNQNILVVVLVMLTAFFCAVCYTILIRGSRIKSEENEKKRGRSTIISLQKLCRRRRLPVILRRHFFPICRMISERQ